MWATRDNEQCGGQAFISFGKPSLMDGNWVPPLNGCDMEMLPNGELPWLDFASSPVEIEVEISRAKCTQHDKYEPLIKDCGAAADIMSLDNWNKRADGVYLYKFSDGSTRVELREEGAIDRGRIIEYCVDIRGIIETDKSFRQVMYMEYESIGEALCAASDFAKRWFKC